MKTLEISLNKPISPHLYLSSLSPYFDPIEVSRAQKKSSLSSKPSKKQNLVYHVRSDLSIFTANERKKEKRIGSRSAGIYI